MDQHPSEDWAADLEEDSPGSNQQAGGQRLFPSDELIAFTQRLTMLRASNYSVQPFVGCLEAARGIVEGESRCASGGSCSCKAPCSHGACTARPAALLPLLLLPTVTNLTPASFWAFLSCCPACSQRQTDMDAVRQFLRNDLQSSADRLLSMGINSRQYADDPVLLEALHQIVHLAAGLLKYRQRQSPAVLAELDVDLQPLMTVLLMVFNHHKPLYHRAQYTPVPDEFLERRKQQDEVLGDMLWVTPQVSTTNNQQLPDDDEDLMQEDEEEIHAWFTYLCNTFGQADGFSVMVQVRSRRRRMLDGGACLPRQFAACVPDSQHSHCMRGCPGSICTSIACACSRTCCSRSAVLHSLQTAVSVLSIQAQHCVAVLFLCRC